MSFHLTSQQCLDEFRKTCPVKQYENETEAEFMKRLTYLIRLTMQRLCIENHALAQKNANMRDLSNEEKECISSFWKRMDRGGLMPLLNFDYYRSYAKVCEDVSKLPYYIPDSFFYAFLDEYFTNPFRSAPIDDKNIYSLLFSDVNRPKEIARYIHGVFYNPTYTPISREDFVAICETHDEVVVKASVLSGGGHGVTFWKNTEPVANLLKPMDIEPWQTVQGKIAPVRSFKQFVIEETIKQHPILAAINSSSVNTIRIMTLERNGEIEALSSVLRMGINGSRVDNCCSGGIVAGIDYNGVIKDKAYNQKGDLFLHHPNGTDFAGVKIPAFNECVALAIKLAYRMVSFSRLISWDFAIDENGEPMLIEMNISYGELDFHQLCNGPIFGDKTEDVLNEVFDNSFTLRKLLGWK